MFDVDTCVCFITNKVAKKMADKMNERLVLVGSTRVQWLVMYYLLRDGRMSQSDLGEKMDIKDSTVVRLIDRMEKEQFVERVKDKKDRRVTYVLLTEKGKKRIEELLPIGEEMSKVFSKSISNEEFEIFNKVLNKMAENADD
ncbi:MarR family winged helix-turn-helix transcriptional regulator [Clostridium magnum]|uniref:Putative HTH-type transcriptional regulator YusO n=1 Tax=Clostridium magnum DSM 2767 TaxID=1121326 RepID=A0A161Y478_9CLOT|nr:MarR family transcriptional regulator [Clostridium magnum]KZL92929.1 putative HTH-type transcriptional regulator YusO [Clostridium magnum DSM 2767]SHJ16693.1 DNA-binding transcriptional regulator, MarR family [Clostridium magnum DSM 2767]